MDEKIAIMFVIGSLVLGVVTLVRLTLDYMSRNRALRTQSDLYNRLIDKFGTSAELLAYLQSDAGQQLLKTPQVLTPSSYARIMNSAQYGAVAVITGIGILGIGSAFSRLEVANVTFVFGWLTITVGAALLVSTIMSYLMSKKFGLINENAEQK